MEKRCFGRDPPGNAKCKMQSAKAKCKMQNSGINGKLSFMNL
jgi:hypothetical protein